MPTFTVGDILTDSEIDKALTMYRETITPEYTGESFHRRVAAELIKPHMVRINKALGQENDAMFLGYVIEAAMIHGGLDRRGFSKANAAAKEI